MPISKGDFSSQLELPLVLVSVLFLHSNLSSQKNCVCRSCGHSKDEKLQFNWFRLHLFKLFDVIFRKRRLCPLSSEALMNNFILCYVLLLLWIFEASILLKFDANFILSVLRPAPSDANAIFYDENLIKASWRSQADA